MNTLRHGFLKGAWRHLSAVPRLMFLVRGWPYLLADCMGRRRRPYRLRTTSGACCEVRPGTSDWWIFLEIFVFGIYQRVEEDIRRSRIIIDVGANVGFFAIRALSLNPAVEIHSFEPFPGNVEQMKKNLLLNANHRVQIHPDAVSDKNATVTLYFTPGDDSGCTLSQTRAHSCSVNAVGVNGLFQACGVSQCDLLKMDCEGSELPILQAAAPEVLAKIRSIIMEYHVPSEVDTLSGILSRAGFACEVLPEIKTLYACRR